MEWIRLLDPSIFITFTLVLARVSGLVITAPIYGGPDIPMQVRGLLAFALAVLIMPGQLGVEILDPGNTITYAVQIGSELLVGLILGLGLNLLFSGIQLAGQIIGRLGGLMLADVFDPTSGISVPLFSRLMFLVTMAIFVTMGGHRMVMAGLLDTFASIPPGSMAVPTDVAHTFVQLAHMSFSLGIRAAAPLIAALLLSTLVMGLISRTLPQLNIMAVGFGLNSILTFAVLTITLGTSTMIFQDQVEPTLEMLLKAIHTPLQDNWLRS